MLELGVYVVGQGLQKLYVSPFAAGGRLLGISFLNAPELFRTQLLIGPGVHRLAVRFKVPPCDTVVSIQHLCARVHMADYTLAGGDCPSELVLDRMPGLILGNGWIGAEAVTSVPEASIGAGMVRVPVIGVDDMAGGATAGPVVARLIVRSQQRQHRVEQPRLLQSQEDRVRSQVGTQPARAQQVLCRPAGRLGWIGQADIRSFAAATLER